MDFKAIGERVRTLRHELGWSQEQLAEEAGVAQGTLSRIENGHVDMRLVTLGFVAKALNIPVTELLGSKPPPGGHAGPAPVTMHAST